MHRNVLHGEAVVRTKDGQNVTVAVQREGTCYPTPTIWRGAPALRFSVSNADTAEDDIVASAAAVRRASLAAVARAAAAAAGASGVSRHNFPSGTTVR